MPSVECITEVTQAGHVFNLHRLTNDRGNSVSICNWGLSIQSVLVPDRAGEVGEVVIGYDDITKYRDNPVSFGATVGRFANRIAGARFSIDGEEYILPANDRTNNLHGGPRGLAHRPWNIRETGNDEQLAFLSATISSPDGFNGFPGNLVIGATVLWTNDEQLIFNYQAVTDAPTVINLTNHSYFNLAGYGNILDHDLRILASHYTPKNDQDVPTGEQLPVAETPFDFRTTKRIGREIELIGGYDHFFIVNGEIGQLRPFAQLSDPFSGRTLDCLSTQPGVQLFTAHFGEGAFAARNGAPLPNYGGLCLETQNFPNAPNEESFPSSVLRPGESYQEKVIFSFGVK